MDDSPLWWSAQRLIAAYQQQELSPVEVADLAHERIIETDGDLHAYTTVTKDLAHRQAVAAEDAYRNGTAQALSGVPISIKDAFHVEGLVSTLGSLAHAEEVAASDSGAVRRLRAAGAVFVGKTNVPEFCQSATCDNLLGPETGNPWDPNRTSGGSSGGAAASVASGSCTMALGSDGGGSIRIPAAFCGLVGFKPTYGVIADEGGFKAFSRFISAGPLARNVADASLLDAVLRDHAGSVGPVPSKVRVGWCPQPEGRPIDPSVATLLPAVVAALSDQGHLVSEVELAIDGWQEIFDPLVLEEEGRRRGHLLDEGVPLTRYEKRSIEASRLISADQVSDAEAALVGYRNKVNQHFGDFDLLVTPATAVPAFEKGNRPTVIDGQDVSRLWGAFPFAAPFNVSAHPALVLPIGFADGLPVAIQLVAGLGRDRELLALAAALELTLDLEPFSSGPVR